MSRRSPGAAAWESLFEGPGPTEPLREMWAQGLGANPAVPDDLRRALLGRSRHLLWRKRPSSVLRHPGLPVPVLVRLLRDPATAEEAAGHPALPVDVMWRMIQQP